MAWGSQLLFLPKVIRRFFSFQQVLDCPKVTTLGFLEWTTLQNFHLLHTVLGLVVHVEGLVKLQIVH